MMQFGVRKRNAAPVCWVGAPPPPPPQITNSLLRGKTKFTKGAGEGCREPATPSNSLGGVSTAARGREMTERVRLPCWAQAVLNKCQTKHPPASTPPCPVSSSVTAEKLQITACHPRQSAILQAIVALGGPYRHSAWSPEAGAVVPHHLPEVCGHCAALMGGDLPPLPMASPPL